MCGRYVVEWLPDEFSERFQLRMIPEFMFASFNAAPTQELPVVLELGDGEREMRTMRWGLVPRWSKPGDAKAPTPFNARAKSILEKPMFRSLFSRKRCLVPANGYYEWKQLDGRKQPYLFTVKDQELFSFAGLYDEFKDEEGEWKSSFTIVTTDANEFSSRYYHRMPVILPKDAEAEWIDRETDDGHAVEHLLQPYPSELMAAYAVSTDVNNVRNNDAHLIEPIQEVEPSKASEPIKKGDTKGQRALW